MLMNRRALGRLGLGAALGALAIAGCSPEAKEPLAASPGMKTTVLKAEGMH